MRQVANSNVTLNNLLLNLRQNSVGESQLFCRIFMLTFRQKRLQGLIFYSFDQ